MDVGIVIDGVKRYVRSGSTVFDACHEAGVYIPHFCYHPKLSIAANCRMCLVEVEKAPKPVPACATYVTDGMVVHTDTPAARAAQKGVMEFLLINHPLDCPICDQGGECQLQDLAVGYGSACTRYGEQKRVVVEKHMGPLITTVMTRCIHCTRCVRFGEEVAGRMELGMAGRGEHSEIMPFIESTVDSELSGNMIDICPVGALNSKPFRFSARTWELERRSGLAQHDSWGSEIILQVKDDEVKRVLPKDREEINECWISDRDRFSYTGFHAPGRCTKPHLRDADASKPREVEWSEALERAADLIKETVREHGPESVGFLLSPQSISEEGLIANELASGIGCPNIDFRLRQRDFTLDKQGSGVPWLGCSIEEISDHDLVFLIGSNPAMELPLLPVRLRRAIAERHTKVISASARSISAQMRMEAEIVAKPSGVLAELAGICAHMAEGELPEWVRELAAESDRIARFAELLKRAKRPAVFLGEQAVMSSNYNAYRQLVTLLSKICGASFGILPPGSNRVGLSLVGVLPGHDMMMTKSRNEGIGALRMIQEPRKAYVLIGCEPLDFCAPATAERAFEQAATIAIGGYLDAAKGYADVFLPSALYPERRGAFVNLEGHAATMAPAVNPPGESRPAWKILRVLGSMLDVPGIDYLDLDELRAKLIAAGDYAKRLNNYLSDEVKPPEIRKPAPGIFERVREGAHFGVDAIVRRAAPLQETAIARRSSIAQLHPDDMAEIGLADGEMAVLSSEGASVECEVRADPKLARGALRAPYGSEAFAALDDNGAIEVSAAAADERQAVAGGS